MASRYLLGFDVGSSSVKASLTDVDNGEIVASAFYPDHEAPDSAMIFLSANLALSHHI
jgi:xylulokinase